MLPRSIMGRGWAAAGSAREPENPLNRVGIFYIVRRKKTATGRVRRRKSLNRLMSDLIGKTFASRS
jgi:hypothetical protein